MNRAGLSLLLCIIIAAPLFCEDSPGLLSLERAREMALLNSTSLAKYRLSMRTDELTELGRKLAWLPSLSLKATAAVPLWGEGAFSRQSFKDSFGVNFTAEFSHTLFDGGKDAIQKAINRLDSEKTRQQALGEYYTVLAGVDSAYYTVLEGQAALEVAENSLNNCSLALSIAEIRLETRIISEVDYLKALGDKEDAENSRNKARRDLALNRAKLRNLLGLEELPGLEDVEVEEDLIRRTAALEDSALDRLYTLLWGQVQEKNPSLVQSRLSSQSAEKSLSLAKRDYVPTLGARLSLGGVDYSVPKGFSGSGGGSLTITGTIPLDYPTIALNVAKKKIAGEQTALDTKKAAADRLLELESAVITLASQAGTYLSARRACDYQEKRFDSVMELYRLSRNSQKDLSDAESALQTSRRALIQARYGFLQALSAIRSLGAFDDEGEIRRMIGAAAQEQGAAE